MFESREYILHVQAPWSECLKRQNVTITTQSIGDILYFIPCRLHVHYDHMQVARGGAVWSYISEQELRAGVKRNGSSWTQIGPGLTFKNVCHQCQSPSSSSEFIWKRKKKGLCSFKSFSHISGVHTNWSSARDPFTSACSFVFKGMFGWRLNWPCSFHSPCEGLGGKCVGDPWRKNSQMRSYRQMNHCLIFVLSCLCILPSFLYTKFASKIILLVLSFSLIAFETTKLTQELAVKLEQGRDLHQWHSIANWEVIGKTLCGKSEDGKSPSEQDWGRPAECTWALYTV